MQLVCISNRPAQLLESLQYWDHLAPFVDRALVLCPADQRSRMVHPGRIELTATDEETALADLALAFARSSDHQSRNLLLRAAISRLDEVDECFLMADDDCRPLALIGHELFTTGGRHRGFYFHRLESWIPAATDYDHGQRRSAALLRRRGLPTLSFSSHMAQIIRKAYLAEAFADFAEELVQGEALDEWSLYFNTASARHPEDFAAAEPYRTLCWPALPTDWSPEVQAPEYLFENFNPELYAAGRLFDGIPTTFDPAMHQEWAAERIRRRVAAQRAYDSATGRAIRRLGWALYRAANAVHRAGHAHPHIERGLASLLPAAVTRRLTAIAEKGHDPAFWRRYG